MSVELAGVIALVFALTAFGVSVGLALIASAVVGTALVIGTGALAPLVAGTVFNTLTLYTALGAVLLIMLGALLDHTGTVLGLPSRPAGTRADPDRAAFFAGGTLGVPLPVAASLIYVGVLTETAIGQLTVAALVPGLALSGLYLLIFGLSRLVRTPPLELGEAPERAGAGVLAVVFRCIVPVIGAVVFIAPIHSGVLTPTEATGLLVVIGLIFVLALFLVSRRAQAGAWPGISAGVSAAALFALILIGVSLFARLMAVGGVPQALQAAIAPWGLDARALTALFVAAALVAGTIVGPLAAVGLAVAAALGVLNSAGVNMVFAGVVLFLTAEAIRVGPRLWRGGFLRQPGGLGSWPNYLAAVAVIAGTIVVFG